MASLQDDLDTLKVIASNLLRQFEKGSKTSNELQSLYDAACSVQKTILRPGFRQRSDADRLSNDVDDLTKIASWNLQELQFLVHPTRERKPPSRGADVDETAKKNQNIFASLQKHTAAFQRLGDYIAGREDWSKLTPKAPRAASVSPDATSRLQPVESSKVTLSVPPSPYQPSVEDAEDQGDEEEEEVKANVEHVHYVPKDDSPSLAAAIKKHPRRIVTPSTPPQVVIRQATDVKEAELSKTQSDTASSPLRSSVTADETSEESDLDDGRRSRETHLHPSSLPKLVTRVEKPTKTLKDLEDEIIRLQTELQKFAESEVSTSDRGRPDLGKRRTSKHKSVDLGHLDEPSTANNIRRPRASTTQSTERPRSFVEGSSYDPYRSEMPPPPRPDAMRRTSSTKSRRQPSRSPRITPYSAVDPQIDSYWEYAHAQNTAEMYGSDPRTSLPTVLEGRKGDGRSARSGHKTRRSTSSAAFEDPRDNFRDFFSQADPHEADFPLFGPPPAQAPPPAQSRSRGNSRANDTSPNAKPYISPHQLHESIPIDPNVREIGVTLEDVYYGVSKRYKVRRQKYNAQTGIVTDEERVLEVPINRGLKPGSKIKFEGAGDQTPEGTRELHFKLAEKPHPLFTRVDYDLHCVLEITLEEALCGWSKTITSICGKDIKFFHPGPTPASWRDDRAGLGMCTFKDPEVRGDLIASISIKYPGPLNESQKRLIRQALGMGISTRNSINYF